MLKTLIYLILLQVSLFATQISDYINKKNCDQIIDKQVYSICYDYKMKGAKYVAYELDGKLVNKLNIKKRSSFYSEKNLPIQYRSYTKDYTKTGYDRGHLANDASFDWSEKSVRKTYSMANIVPQKPMLNRKVWIKAEKLERKIASSLGFATVINGVIYPNNPKRIGKNKVAVPSAFWKMIYNDKENYKKCFYYENIDYKNIKKETLKKHQVDCNKLN